MTIKILSIFFISLTLALIFGPFVKHFAFSRNLMDRPSSRKVHAEPVPRVGGIILYLACLIPFVIGIAVTPAVATDRFPMHSVYWMLSGATLVFLLGLVDDVHGLRPGIKFVFQGVAAFLAYHGGIYFEFVELPWGPSFSLGVFSMPFTIFWFLLVINAINLIDGLDGLAAGVSLFVALVLLTMSLLGGKYLVSLGLAALAGACLGFLRYNFNPASIFMGDSGSYFLGFMLASLSVLGSMKSQATVAIIIPIVALGVPLMDTLLAPIRRFIIGQDLFQPDKRHIHHQLLRKGLTHRKAVLWMYGATIFLGIFALLIVNTRDERAGFILIILAALVIVGIRKLGYLEYFAVDKMIGYFRDVTDEMGIKRDRRTFLNRQIEIKQAKTTDELWDRVIEALEQLRIDDARMHFNGLSEKLDANGPYTWKAREISVEPSECEYCVLSLDLPLLNNGKSYGVLHLRKDLVRDPITPYTLRRIEHLRRSVVNKIQELEEEAEANLHMNS